jgi:hypothetical protein
VRLVLNARENMLSGVEEEEGRMQITSLKLSGPFCQNVVGSSVELSCLELGYIGSRCHVISPRRKFRVVVEVGFGRSGCWVLC